MDETTQSRTSDVAAAATRKRRSSILKSQRPPRTPFCELEFNVCTPTDTTKSRRVSFSKRKGIAEFATNEATTTWKNFYEEHNKSLESSGNDSAEGNHPKQSISHLGKRIFDQQFEEVEGIDFLGAHNPGINIISSSMNNINFSQPLECTDSKLLPPQSTFELSAFTEHKSKLFSDDLGISCMGEITDRVNVNFSVVQPIGVTDDLDEIQKDLQRQSNVVCHGPFTGRQNMSEYIEVDLNMTHVSMKNDESDMSITDTIHSPKVQDVSKSCSIDRKMNLDKDWVTDKENIAINPYIAPKESINFAINEEPEKVLVFDGKRLIVQSETPNELYRQKVIASEITPQRKTIVLNCDDDLPNFEDDNTLKDMPAASNVGLKQSMIFDCDMSITQAGMDVTQNKQKTILYNDEFADISVTQAAANAPVIIQEKRRTVIFENETASIMQALPTNIKHDEKRRTIVFGNDDGDISMTQALPNIIHSNKAKKEERRTIVFTNETCNISITQAIPSNIIASEIAPDERKTIVENESHDAGKTSTMIVEKDLNTERRRTVMFESDMGDISVTQVLPSNIVLPQKLNATNFGGEYDISMTQVVPTNVILGNENKKAENRRTTVLYDNDNGNISITQLVPTNQILQQCSSYPKTESNTVTSEMSVKNEINNMKKTVIYEEDVNLSMTQAVNINQILPGMEQSILNNLPEESNRRKTIIFENDIADISMTQAVPMNQVIEAFNLQRTQECDNIVTPEVALQGEETNNWKTIVSENGNADVSMTDADDAVDMVQGLQRQTELDTDKNTIKTEAKVVYNIDTSNVKDYEKISLIYDNDQDILMNNMSETSIDKKRTIVYDDVDTMLKRENRLIDVDAPYSSQGAEIMNINNTTGLNPKKMKVVISEDTKIDLISETVYEHCTVNKNLSMLSVDNGKEISKPIPGGLDILNHDVLDKSEKGLLCDDMLLNLPTVVSEVVIYQAGINTPNIDVFRSDGNDTVKNVSKDAKMSHNTTVELLSTSGISKLFHKHRKPKDKHNAHNDDSEKRCGISEKLSNPLKVTEIKTDDNSAKMPTKQSKKSILIDLLDMSNSSKEAIDEISRKKTIKFDSIPPSTIEGDNPEPMISNTNSCHSNRSMLFIIKDSDENIDDKGENLIKAVDEEMYKTPSVNPVENLHSNINVHKTSMDELLSLGSNNTSKHDHNLSKSDYNKKKMKSYNEKSPGKRKSGKNGNDSFNQSKMSPKSGKKSFRLANNTNELLDMLSDFTENRKSMNLDTHLEQDEDLKSFGENLDNLKENKTTLKAVEFKECTALDNKLETSRLKRLTFVPNEEANNPILSNEDAVRSEVSIIEPVYVAPQEESTNTEYEEISDIATKKYSESTQQGNEGRISKGGSLESTQQRRSSLSSKEGNDTLASQKRLSFLAQDSTVSLPLPRLSMNPKQQSAYSREDLLNKPSMAGAALQKSSFEIDENEKMYESEDISIQEVPYRKTVRLSKEVIKTLNFDDEDSINDVNEVNETTETKSLLKKNAFGEVSYIKETKSKVIPDFMKEVSDGIKELMDDLVKPMVDVLPFPTTNLDRSVNRCPSVRSNEIQTNLLPSSQIDLTTELSSVPASVYDIHKESPTVIKSVLKSRAKHSDTQSQSSSVPTSDKSWVNDTRNFDSSNVLHKSPTPQKREFPEAVLIFDHNNPLNNVFLVPPSAAVAHRYNPENISYSDSENKMPIDFQENENVCIHYQVKPIVSEKIHDTVDKDIQSNMSIMSRPVSVDKYTDSVSQNVKDSEVNTVIAMKDNRELLKASSSLTFVDDMLKRCTFDEDVDTDSCKSHEPISSVKVLYKTVANKAENTHLDTKMKPAETLKPKKRVYSSRQEKHKHCTFSSLDITPKPVSKTRKYSTSNINQGLNNVNTFGNKKKSPEKDIPQSIMKKSSAKPSTTYTVQQCTAVVNGDTDTVEDVSSNDFVDLNALSSAETIVPSSVNTAACLLSEVVGITSFTSSKNLMEQSSELNTSSGVPSTKSSMMEWSHGSNSVSTVHATDSNVNVLELIDALPFIGSNECEWESCSNSAWCFRVLHSRIRLTVKYPGDRDVCPNTPVSSLEIETVYHDKKNPIANLCVKFGSELMRYYMSRGYYKCSDVPVLLRRVAAAARLTGRWARAMHNIKLQLACTVHEDGWVALKVANIALRCVWEVTARIELVVEDARSPPSPRACSVRVTRVIGADFDPPSLDTVMQTVPADWGHAPTALWKIFKYLKHKKREEDLILAQP